MQARLSGVRARENWRGWMIAHVSRHGTHQTRVTRGGGGVASREGAGHAMAAMAREMTRTPKTRTRMAA
jgi:hypothetical protein